MFGCGLEQPQLPLIRRWLTAQARPTAALQLVLFQRPENLGCAPNDRRREACKAGDLDSVTPIGSARNDLVQEHNLVAEFARRYMEVHDA